MCDRAPYAFALVQLAAVIGMESKRISHAPLAFGGLDSEPWRTLCVNLLKGSCKTIYVGCMAGEAHRRALGVRGMMDDETSSA